GIEQHLLELLGARELRALWCWDEIAIARQSVRKRFSRQCDGKPSARYDAGMGLPLIACSRFIFALFPLVTLVTVACSSSDDAAASPASASGGSSGASGASGSGGSAGAGGSALTDATAGGAGAGAAAGAGGGLSEAG